MRNRFTWYNLIIVIVVEIGVQNLIQDTVNQNYCGSAENQGKILERAKR